MSELVRDVRNGVLEPFLRKGHLCDEVMGVFRTGLRGEIDASSERGVVQDGMVKPWVWTKLPWCSEKSVRVRRRSTFEEGSKSDRYENAAKQAST